MIDIINKSLNEHLAVLKEIDLLKHDLAQLAKEAIEALKNGKKIILAGNGGSASDAQHIAAELVGRFETKRKGLASISLSTDTSALTAIANDFGFDKVYSRQLEAIGQSGDLFIGISTSGNSPNIISAIKSAKELGITSWGLSGKSGGEMNQFLCERNIVVGSSRTARIQEAHIFLGHTLCELIDEAFKNDA
jgi:D-sedoheptulose 7-phosphate isomerase